MEEEKSYEDLSVGDITKAFFKGVYNATIGAAKNTLAMGRELATSSEARATLVEDIGNEIASIKENGVLDYSIKKVEDKWNEFSSASPEQQLEMLGELVPATATTITTLGSPQLIAGVKKIPADEAASKGGSQIVQNGIRGRAFEGQVIDALGTVKNNTGMVGTTRAGVQGVTIPDTLLNGLTEIKDVQRLSFSSQLQMQFDIASQQVVPFNLVVSPNTSYISGPLQRAVQSTGGTIQIFNPATGAFKPW